MQILTANLLSLLHFAWIHIKKLFALSMSVCVCVWGGGRNGIPGVQENHKTLALTGDLEISSIYLFRGGSQDPERSCALCALPT